MLVEATAEAVEALEAEAQEVRRAAAIDMGISAIDVSVNVNVNVNVGVKAGAAREAEARRLVKVVGGEKQGKWGKTPCASSYDWIDASCINTNLHCTAYCMCDTLSFLLP